MSESKLLELLDPEAEDHFLAKTCAQMGCEDLRKAVVGWEDQVERLSSDYLNPWVQDRSNLLRQVDRLRHQFDCKRRSRYFQLFS